MEIIASFTSSSNTVESANTLAFVELELTFISFVAQSSSLPPNATNTTELFVSHCN